MKIEKIRETPLLSPPNANRTWQKWMEPSKEDVDKIRSSLDELRDSQIRQNAPTGGGILELHSLMKSLDISQRVTPLDSKLINESFATARGSHDGWTICEMHIDMRNLGMGHEITTQDVDDMRDKLEKARKAENGLHILTMHHYMRKLGLGEMMTEKDRDTISKTFANTLGGDGYVILMLHHHMSEIGLGTEPSQEAWRKIEDNLDKSRVEDNGRAIARMLHWLRDAPPRKPGEEDAEMPPLKRFEG